jgi:hypothetical protein
MSIKLGEFDDVESANTFAILDIMESIKESAPSGVKVNWEFPGYVSIVLSNGTEVAFGESLESDTGYSWNDFNREGTNNYAGSFDDLADIDLIVKELWRQVAPVLEERAI